MPCGVLPPGLVPVENRQPQLAWLRVNEVSVRKSTPRAKLNAVSKEEGLQGRKEHFKDLLGNAPEITDNPTEVSI